MAAMMAPPSSQKRKAVLDGVTGPTKRARHTTRDMDEDYVENDDTPMDDHSTPESSALSEPWTEEPSIAETAATSTSKRPKIYPCDFSGCDKMFDRQSRVQIHMRSHTNERPFVCEEDDCGKTFRRAEHLERHRIDRHTDDRDYICPYPMGTAEDGPAIVCGKAFSTATRLKRHVAAHEAKSEMTCTEVGCGKVFRKLETLQRHIKADHLHEKPFRCTEEVGEQGEECGQEFSKADSLKTHVAREHSGMRYFCEICPTAIATAPLSNAMETTDETTPGSQEQDRVGYPTYALLQSHITLAHPPTCPHASCNGKPFPSNRALKAHLEIEHSSLTSRQTHLCDWPGCGRGFTKAGNLKVHYQSVHLKARDFVCGGFDPLAYKGAQGLKGVEGWNGEGCGSQFGTKANLEDHIRTQHLGLPGKIKPCRIRKAQAKAASAAATSSRAVEVGETATTRVKKGDSEAMSMLTGHGYDVLPNRAIACLVPGCAQRFGNEWHLAEHLELGHGWFVDDVSDALAERAATQGGDFWIGGHGPGGEGQEEDELRRGLVAALGDGREGDEVRSKLGAEGGGMQGYGEMREALPVGADGSFAGSVIARGRADVAVDPVLAEV
ncbi:hypothetical protein LTR53_007200 [Teratosphaeriaceae sp. CCFEE 6253]|nr:hypothetical protein LTR53_007200 [Teratosphaeriaceae sp. CCFEE 6253]